MLSGKKILIGITGSIAAYKIPFLIRNLIREGAEVKVVMTVSACDFVTPLTLSALSQNPVSIKPFNQSDGQWHSHIELGSWADLFLIAPVSANTLAKMASGITDNLLTATYLAARCPVFFAPAMDVDMYTHPTTQANIRTIEGFGNQLIAPREGELASGLSGYGRMEEPEVMVAILKKYFETKLSLKGKNVLVTSGPTLEAIDPVRFLSNHSSGRMGNALALDAANREARVTLISGPVKDYPLHPNIRLVKVSSAAEMFDACLSSFKEADYTFMAAAVADYSPSSPSYTKVKKGEIEITIRLTKTRDILQELGKMKSPGQLLCGFALETDHELENARKKLEMKNLDFIVLNSLNDAGAGFGTETNKITILDSKGNLTAFPVKSKTEVAADIVDFAVHFPV